MSTPTSTTSCPFCQISHSFPPTRPILSPPTPSPTPSDLFPPTYIILATESVLAFLDIQPLTRGHVLVCPRRHFEKVTDMKGSENLSVGVWLPILARAVMEVVGVSDFNIVQNNGENAAQVVPHVHFHIIPRPSFQQREAEALKRESRLQGSSSSSSRPRYLLSKYGDGVREDLDDEEGERMAADIRKRVFLEVDGLEKDEEGRRERRILSSL